MELKWPAVVWVQRWLPYGMFGAALAFSVPAFFLDRFPGDLRLAAVVGSVRSSPLTGLMEFVSFVGKGWPMIALASVIAVCFYLFHQRRACLAVLGGLTLMGVNPLLKLIVQRERPPAELVDATQPFGGLGFPSGHAFQAIILFGILAILASDLITDVIWRRIAQGSLVALVLTIGISRVYLGAHWTSDVLGGYLWGAAFLLVVFRWYRGHRPAPASQWQMAAAKDSRLFT